MQSEQDDDEFDQGDPSVPLMDMDELSSLFFEKAKKEFERVRSMENDHCEAEQEEGGIHVELENIQRKSSFSSYCISPSKNLASVANKDEALRAFELGTRAFGSGEYESAQKLFRQSLRLWECVKSRDMLNKTEHIIRDFERRKEEARQEQLRREREQKEREREREQERMNQEKERSEANNQQEDDTARTEKAEGKDMCWLTWAYWYVWFTSWWSHRRNETEGFTKAHIEEVRRVETCDDHYAVLGVSRSATAAQIKKAYHNLALRLHPDKNTAPRADKAFHDLQAAYACLIDASQRSSYDSLLLVYHRKGERGDGRRLQRSEESGRQKYMKSFMTSRFGRTALQWLHTTWIFIQIGWKLLYGVPLVLVVFLYRLTKSLVIVWLSASWQGKIILPLYWLLRLVLALLYVGKLGLTLPWKAKAYYRSLLWRYRDWKQMRHTAYQNAQRDKQRKETPPPTRDGRGFGGGGGGGHFEANAEAWEDNGRVYYRPQEGGKIHDITEVYINFIKAEMKKHPKRAKQYAEVLRRLSDKRQETSSSEATKGEGGSGGSGGSGGGAHSQHVREGGGGKKQSLKRRKKRTRPA